MLCHHRQAMPCDAVLHRPANRTGSSHSTSSMRYDGELREETRERQKNQIRPLQEGNEASSRQNVAQLGRDDDDDVID